MNFDVEQIWADVQGHLVKDLKGPSFQTWVRPTKLVSISLDKAVIAVKNDFNRNFLIQSYIEKISLAIEKVIKKKVIIEIVVKADLDLREFIPSIAILESRVGKKEEVQTIDKQGNAVYLDHTFKYKSNLNPAYNFESFVVGQNNQFCHAAALAISESYVEQYNPLFLYGGVGLGKTHLTHAIANYALEQNSNLKVKYISSESFTNELIHSIKSNDMNKFRGKYREVDLLMIDDVQFLAGKEATQEEFFHTFNTLKENGKQIILTSDRPPSSLSSMADRLRNRFEGGLIADIQSPDLETRIAILLLKAMQLNVEIQSEVAEYIATIYPNNIRELEGALKRVYAYLSFTHEDLNLKNVQRIISGNINSAVKPAPEAILRTVANFYNISYEDLISAKRSSDLTSPRHIAIYMLHDFYDLSFPRIGELLSNRTHSSAIYAYKQTKKKLQVDKELPGQINHIRSLIEKRRKS